MPYRAPQKAGGKEDNTEQHTEGTKCAEAQTRQPALRDHMCALTKKEGMHAMLHNGLATGMG